MNNTRMAEGSLSLSALWLQCVAISVAMLFTASVAAQETEPTVGPEKDDEAETGRLAEVESQKHLVTWLHDFERAQQLGRTRRAPVLVIAGATWCGPCRMLDEEIKAAVVQKQLERWVPVHLDVDDHPDKAAELAVSAIPAIRILSPDGRLLASSEGFLESEELAAWLAEQFANATANSASQAPSADRLTAVTVLKILKDFRSRETTVREAAISRLVSVPEVAAAAVVTGFADGGLSERLALLDLLSAWDAPIEDIDPWIPASITNDRLQKLEDWVAKKEFKVADDSTELSPVELIEASRILRSLPSADATAASALREQLARMGRRTLPLIRAVLEDESDPVARQRITEARYRVAGSPELEIEWPAGMLRLASTNFDERIKATTELTRLATSREEALLLELFSDTVPLVREIALKGLTHVSGSASGALVRMLDDPDPNVRAAVLKQLAEAPNAALIPRIAAYAKKETDPDLVVHAIRFLRAIEQQEAVKAMSALFNHASWRVRAEAADGIYQLVKQNDVKAARTDAALGQAFLNLLQDEDEFVAGVAIRTLQYLNAPDAANRLVEVAESRPPVAAAAVAALGSRFMSRSGIKDKVTAFAGDSQPAVRAAATIALLNQSDKASHVATILASLRDDESSVRIAVANAVFTELLEELKSRLEQDDSGVADLPVLNRQSRAESSSSVLSGIFDALLPGHNEQPVEANPNEIANVDIAERGLAADTALQTIRDERSLGGWFYELEVALKPMLSSTDKDESLSAARSLVVIGNSKASEILRQAAGNRTNLPEVASVFCGLPWAERSTLFDLAIATAETDDERHLLAEALAECHDPRSPANIWELLASGDAGARLVAELGDPLQQSYFSEHQYSFSNAAEHEKQHLINDCQKMITSGTIWQKTSAFALLALADAALAQQAAQTIFDDETQPASLRGDALRLLLCFSDDDVATQTAIAAITYSEPEIAEPALHFLAMGRAGVRFLSDVIPIRNVDTSSTEAAGTTPIVPRAPPGITNEQLKAFTQSTSMKTQACAAYLAALLGDEESEETVIAFWQSSPDDAPARRMAYRAIAAGNHVQHVPVLRRMYQEMKAEEWGVDMADFYWTIRIMKGADILDLRKQIRTEQGADALKGNGAFGGGGYF